MTQQGQLDRGGMHHELGPGTRAVQGKAHVMRRPHGG